MDSLNQDDVQLILLLVRLHQTARLPGVNQHLVKNLKEKLEYIVALMDGRQITHLAPAGNAGETGEFGSH